MATVVCDFHKYKGTDSIDFLQQLLLEQMQVKQSVKWGINFLGKTAACYLDIG